MLGMTHRRECLLHWVEWVLVEDLYDRWWKLWREDSNAECWKALDWSEAISGVFMDWSLDLFYSLVLLGTLNIFLWKGIGVLLQFFAKLGSISSTGGNLTEGPWWPKMPKMFTCEAQEDLYQCHSIQHWRIQSKCKMQLVTVLKKVKWNWNRCKKDILGWSKGWEDYQMIDKRSWLT